MTATCLSDGKQVEVIKYKNIYYCKIDFHIPFEVFYKWHKPIPKNHEAFYYMIDGVLYNTILTNDLDCIARDSMKRYSFKKYRILKKYKQLSIFDLEEE